MEQLKFKLEKNIGIYKSAGKVRKDVFLKKVVSLVTYPKHYIMPYKMSNIKFVQYGSNFALCTKIKTMSVWLKFQVSNSINKNLAQLLVFQKV